MLKKVVVLGSTGSIGQNALAVAAHLPHRLQVVGLAVKSNLHRLEAQIAQFQPQYIAVCDLDQAAVAQKKWPHLQVLGGIEGVCELASLAGVDLVISALVGAAGIQPTLSAIQAGKTIALANKEALVAAGAYLMPLLKKHGAQLIPVDSEHNAIFQCLHRENPTAIHRLILTSSGGPFRQWNRTQLEQVTVEQALKHPNFSMGAKITIDSSTLMNKGLEVIEAHFLFDIPLGQIEVLVHPQQIIHGMVEFVDGSTLAQMGEPDMKAPIQYAMMFPERLPGLLKSLDFTRHAHFDFLPPNRDLFRCLDLSYHALQEGGTLPCFMNAANEVLVGRFLNREIGWLDISAKLETLMAQHTPIKNSELDTILAVDAMARTLALSI